ncbi:MAG: L,D-transpeptidase family protein [Gammaproteobacteria bacterium]|nr:L,D-transpeptidase family protein [Gammaproteobacteria bacterium]MDH5305340.1 L,D-transpeptidase family protein [Gammaproteobacteria bacterium]MDH5323487.1 L,D-transpeptidase family protein [Gammaproteobacteria bacterium]
MLRTLFGTLIMVSLWHAPLQASDFPVADKVVVEKGARKLHLLKDGEAFRSYNIALGIRPEGTKQHEGDYRTPEGRYLLDMRNPDSEFFLSIHISYPNRDDVSQARSKGLDPGGAIMIHGQPNTPTRSEAYYRTQDWTNGCIAVSNSDMIDIWLMTANNTPIEILP